MDDVPENSAKNHGDVRRFAAFISYSHADTVAAAKLQRKLERYRLPKHIAQARNGKRSLGRIFRDREDLAAAASLSTAIREAITEAEALVVMCSPEAANSPWVAAEIDLFRSLHPESPILAVLLSGEPAVSFPPALTKGGVEPLAADLRPNGDGAQLGFLKIVAGIACIPLDSLIQRDAQRRIRRVTAITVGALAAMLVMGIMTTLALSARNEAARQRAEAEGLVEYMLTDLREKLKGVGRLAIMEDVNRRAMQHYSGQGNLANLPADSLERRARLLHAMGEDNEMDGNIGLALKQFQEAHRVTAALMAQESKDEDRIFAHAQSEYWIGEALLRQQKLEKVTPHFVAYQRLARKLTKLNPRNPKWLREAGYASGNLCTLKLERHSKPAEAVSLCEEALKQMRAVLALMPNDRTSRMDVANRLAWLADARKANGLLSEALKLRLEQEAIVRSLVNNAPDDMDLQEIWLKTQLMIAEAYALNGSARLATLRIFEARKTHRMLVGHDPENLQWSNWKKNINQVESNIRHVTN